MPDMATHKMKKFNSQCLSLDHFVLFCLNGIPHTSRVLGFCLNMIFQDFITSHKRCFIKEIGCGILLDKKKDFSILNTLVPSFTYHIIIVVKIFGFHA
jgi:hypothetical protein